jgi:hypothetical protein
MWKQRNDDNRQAPTYAIEDLHQEIGQAIAKAKASRIHPVLIERALKSAADSFAQHRAMSEPML